MEYWEGLMDWAIDPDWKCQTCETPLPRIGNFIMYGLTWGLVNGECRCDQCHTQYSMRDGKTMLTTPECRLKPEYVEPAKRAWQKYHKPIDEVTDEEWDSVMQ